MQRITALVRSAVGFSQSAATRSKSSTCSSRARRRAAAPREPGMFDLSDLSVMRIIEIVAALVAALAFTFFVLGPLVRGLVRGGGGCGRTGGCARLARRLAIAAPSSDGAARRPRRAWIDIAQIQGRVRASSVKKVAEVVEQHPDESVQIIRGWLNNAM